MRQRRLTHFLLASAAALLLPLLLAVSRVHGSSPLDWTAQVALHWLLMASPGLPFILLGGASRRMRSWMPWPLTALCVLLVAYHAWAQWWLPQEERHLAQLFYATLTLPLALLMLLAQGALYWLTRRRKQT